MFRHFAWVRQPADTDCVISAEYYSELLNHVSKNCEVLARRKFRSVFLTEQFLSRFSQNWDKIFKNGLWDSVFPGFAYLGKLLTVCLLR